MRLTNIPDCITCSNSIVYGSPDSPCIECSCVDSVARKLFSNDGRYCASRCSYYKRIDKSPDGKISQDKALQFMLAGRAEFILHSTKTKDNFKYRIDRKESSNDKYEFVYFINILHGSEKTYAGHMWFDDKTNEFYFSKGAKGQIDPKDLYIRSLLFVLNKLVKGDIVGNLEVYHLGKCGHCGKKLTTPESIITGLGPTCSKNLGIPRIKLR